MRKKETNSETKTRGRSIRRDKEKYSGRNGEGRHEKQRKRDRQTELKIGGGG